MSAPGRAAEPGAEELLAQLEPAPDDVLHATCCRPDYWLSDGPVYALCGHDVTGHRIHLDMPEDALVCRACDELVASASQEGLDCARVCPRLLFGPP